MPRIKTSSLQKSKRTSQRLRIIDEIISSPRRTPLSRVGLLSSVNRALDSKVSYSTLDKDIRLLKDLIEDNEEGAELRMVDGQYRYTVEGYSYFKDTLTEEEMKLFILLASLSLSYLDEGMYAVMERIFAKVADRNLSKLLKTDLGNTARILSRDKSAAGKFRYCARIFERILARETVCFEVDLGGVKTRRVHMSPYQLVEREGKLWLIGYEQLPNGRMDMAAYRLSEMHSVGYSPHPYYEDRLFDYTQAFDEWSRKARMEEGTVVDSTDSREELPEVIRLGVRKGEGNEALSSKPAMQPIDTESRLVMVPEDGSDCQPGREASMMMMMDLILRPAG